MTEENMNKVEQLKTLLETVSGKKVILKQMEIVNDTIVPKTTTIIPVDQQFKKQDRSDIYKAILNRKME